MFLSKLLQNVRTKVMMALAGFTVLLGAGAVVTVGVTTKENEVVETKADSTGTLYFVGNYNWSNYKYDNTRCWPYMSATFNDGSSYSRSANGAMDRNPNFNKDDRTYVWYFADVPLKPMYSLTFNFAQSHSQYVSFKSETYDQWINSSGVHYANVFGINGDGWSYSNHVGKTGTYYYSSSYAYIWGSFAEHSEITWTDWPSQSNSFEWDSSDETYKITLNVDAGDEFKYTAYNCLANKNTNPASWGLDSNSQNGYQTNGRIAVYDNGTLISNNGNWASYISAGTAGATNIKFVKGGRVALYRTSNSAGDYDIKINFLSSGRPAPASTETEPDAIRGTFNGWSGATNPISFNYERGRYESVVAVFSNDEFKFTYGGEWIDLAAGSLTKLNSATVGTAAGANPNLIVTSATAYYVFGYYFSNDNAGGTPTRTRTIFIDKLSSVASTQDAAEALCKRIAMYMSTIIVSFPR